jgi:UDP-N-acetylglucosamine 2-epimerase
MRACIVVGTRPEAIKLAPVVLRLRATAGAECTIVNTGQHRELCVQALDAFGIWPDVDLDTMASGQSLGQLTAKLFARLDTLLESQLFDWVIVQGDTTSAMVGAMVAFYRRIGVAHVEAGLRTYDRWSPFPEEINRTIIGHVSDRHFPPTQKAADNLIRAGVNRDNILVTGNTVIDAVTILRHRLAARHLDDVLPAAAATQMIDGRLLLVTSHRRESFGTGIENICLALIDLAERYRDCVIVYPVHLNPKVREPVMRLLGGHPRVHLLAPLPYLDLMVLVAHCTLVLTDSGGLQEEAPSFGKPVLILRDVTERPEVVDIGAARLVGTRREAIVRNTCDLLDDAGIYTRMAGAGNPFGDGHASERIVDALMCDRVRA